MFLLSNNQRQYFGLLPIHPSWETMQIEDATFFFREDTLCKIIYRHTGPKEPGYYERDYDLATTEQRSMVLPKTSHGKKKPLSLTHVLDFRCLGFYFSCNFTKGSIVVHNPTNLQTLVSETNPAVFSDETLQHWVEQHIQQCPPGRLQEIAALLQQKRKRVRYRSGDVFTLPLPDGTFAFGRILLDLFRLSKAHVLSPSWGDLIIQIYRFTTTHGAHVPDELRSKPTFPSQVIVHTSILHGQFPLVGHLAVEASDLDFPEFIQNVGARDRFFIKGGIRVQIQVPPELDQDLPCPTFGSGIPIHFLQQALQGTREWCRPHVDLRAHPFRAPILQLAGLSPEMTYDQMCEKTTRGPVSRELIAASQRRPARS